jgi:hypothetical protein
MDYLGVDRLNDFCNLVNMIYYGLYFRRHGFDFIHKKLLNIAAVANSFARAGIKYQRVYESELKLEGVRMKL